MQHACTPCVHSRVGGRDEGHVMSHSGATETGLLGKLKTSLLKKTKQKTNRGRIAAVNFYSCPLVPDNE